MTLNNLPVVILVEPQLATNVGLIARVMLNFNITELRLVKPRDKDVIKNALPASAGADMILTNSKIYSKISDSVADLNVVYATTQRERHLNKPFSCLNNTFIPIKDHNAKLGFLFGKESNGLSNDDLSYANILIKIHTNPKFSSLNIVQAVALLCYEWNNIYKQYIDTNTNFLQKKQSNILADFKDLENFFSFIENALNVNKNLSQEKLPTILKNFRNIFLRVQLTKKEVRTLYRVINELKNLRD